jgi:hypothetical protein
MGNVNLDFFRDPGVGRFGSGLGRLYGGLLLYLKTKRADSSL